MFGFLRAKSPKNRNFKRQILQLEMLEERKLMTVNAWVDFLGILNIRGNDLADTVTVTQVSGRTNVSSTDSTGAMAVYNFAPGVKSLDIRTFGGNDVVENNTNLHSIMYGGSGDDKLNGGSASDYLFGEAGSDTLRGNAGPDMLYGGSGNDYMYGNGGSDWLQGDEGDDTLVGGGAMDYIYGGLGNDWIAGDDGAGSSSVDGQSPGNDFIHGNEGNDTIRGDNGSDQLYGDSGNDYIDGGRGNDRLWGGDGFDSLYGQAGDDFLDAGSSSGEYINGGDGLDFNAYKTVVNGASPLDLSQGSSPDCFILAGMGAVAKTGFNISSRITYVGDGKYNVALFKANADGSYSPTSVRVKFEGRLNATDPAAHFRNQEGESWTVIMSRAIASLLNYDLAGTAGGYTGDVMAAILGRKSGITWSDKVGQYLRDPLLDYLYQVQGAAVTVSSRDGLSSSGLIVSDHAYVVQSVVISGYTMVGFQFIPQYTIILVNPWGTDNSNGMTSGENDGVVAISGNQFRGFFEAIVVG